MLIGIFFDVNFNKKSKNQAIRYTFHVMNLF